jgi:hypothetical protein
MAKATPKVAIADSTVTAHEPTVLTSQISAANFTIGRYTSEEVAEALKSDCKAHNVRSRRTPWADLAVGADKVRVRKRYTELGWLLLLDYDDRVVVNQLLIPDEWVEEIQRLLAEAAKPIENETLTASGSEVIDVDFVDELDDNTSVEPIASSALALIASGVLAMQEKSSQKESQAITHLDQLDEILKQAAALSRVQRETDRDFRSQSDEADLARRRAEAAANELRMVRAERDARAQIRAALGES